MPIERSFLIGFQAGTVAPSEGESNANQGSGLLDSTKYFGVSRRKTEGEGEALFQSNVGPPQ